jgi:hypothetical protein
LGRAAHEIVRLVRARRGYVAGNDVAGASGERRSGTWTVRVPVEAYETFLADVARLGEVQKTHAEAEDVGEEFYDVDARLRAKRLEEQRLLVHMERSTARLTDILAVERELSRVRGEVERMEGRLRFLADQTALTTATITVHEARSFVPSRPVPFGAQAARTLSGSVAALGAAVRGATLAALALLPWLVVVGVPALLVWRAARRRRTARSDRNG